MNRVEYHIRVSVKGLLHAADMVRYDQVFALALVDTQTVEVVALKFTQARWESFLTSERVQIWTEKTLTVKEYQDRVVKAVGFAAGFRGFNTVLEVALHDDYVKYLLPVHIEG